MKGKIVAIIGCGTMGRGIARLAARHGMSVIMFDADPHAGRRALTAVTAEAARYRDSKNPAANDRASIPPVLANTILEAVQRADVVVEAVPEVLEIKTPVLREIVASGQPGSLLGTNTSTISIAELEASCECPGRIVGIHFFNPAERMRLVEVIRSPQTPDVVVDRAEEFARTLTRTPIVVKDSPGFVTSRLGLALGTEAMRVLESGIATASAIDVAMTLGYNHPMGPLELADLVGLDARLNNLRSIYAARREEQYRPPRILEALVAEGNLGRKTSRGFYLYDEHGRRTGEAPLISDGGFNGRRLTPAPTTDGRPIIQG
ncbi:MAG TPA: 3-hydroxyacyl-CoA dehydrogenase family protein [Trebonia sp.]|nr:3-hydroxyacyl-CoA dehydrogenase family protein [Trebonia sp.]